MTSLLQRLRRLIANSGPIGVAEYMIACLFDPEAGYYTTREPFGIRGDFITAPEVSQMFGELIAVWAYSAWQGLGRPIPVTLAEIGPGRGTLMADMLRTLDRLDAGFVTRTAIAMIEASPRLAEAQRGKLANGRARAQWLENVDQLRPKPLIIVGNEIFDALPTRQYVRTADGWRERVITIDQNDELAFAAGAGTIDVALLPAEAKTATEGAIFEAAPAREALMQSIAGHIARHGGAGIFFDYGHLAPGLGDTLQALRDHAFDDVLAHPGEADLTSHVDFSALASVAASQGLDVRMATQGEFLLRMGLLERAGALGAKADNETRARLETEARRLAGDDEMGSLFKVLIVTPKGMRLPPFSRTD